MGHPDAQLISTNSIIPDKNSLTIIRPDYLSIAQGADPLKFEELKQLMAEGIVDININEIISNNRP